MAGINGPVRTVRIEGRQLRALTYRQWGVMVDTLIYDAEGRVLEDAEYLPGGNPDIRRTWEYDKDGNEIGNAFYVHDQLNRRSTIRYDSRNRKVEEVTFDSNGRQSSKFVFRYGKRGRQIAWEVPLDRGIRRRSIAILDNQGHRLQITEFAEDGSANGRTIYRYGVSGQRTAEISYYEKNGGTHSTKNTYVYDERGALIEEALYFDEVLDHKKLYKRDPQGNVIESVETDGKGQIKEKRNWSYEFDQEGNWTRGVISEWNAKARSELIQPTYEYRRTFTRVNDATIGLWNAAWLGDEVGVSKLLHLSADVNASHPDGGTALIKAAARGHRNVVQILLSAGAQVNQKDAEGWTALMWAAEHGQLGIAKLLLEARADPNAKNAVGAVAIMPASLNGHLDMLRLLIDKGADINAAAGDGSTALMVSAQAGQTESAKFLLAAGAGPNQKTTAGLTALFFAAAAEKVETIGALLNKGVDINSRANDGMTPLMVAASQSSVEIVKFLVDRCANINATTTDGRTALSMAIKAKREASAELLRKAGAK